MIRTKICQKVFDSNAEPFIEQKHVVLCRSGIQLYHKSELAHFMSDGNQPPTDKEWYREYRPANVVVRAKKLCASLPVTKEHPSTWVTPDNWKELAGGTTDKQVDVVALSGESEGEIGLESTVTFYDRELYDYYEDNNKEVSLGYECTKHWVDNPDEVGYDIILDEITEVNHLAITRAGRGGSSVAVIDTIAAKVDGGLKPMRTGIFAWVGKGKQTDSSATFGAQVFDALKKAKGSTDEDFAGEMKCVLDSCAVLKDCDGKKTLVDAVRDCFDNRDKALEHEAELTKAFDSMYVSVSGDSLEEIVNAFRKVGNTTSHVIDSADTDKTEDSEKPEEGKTEDSEKPEEDKAEDPEKPEEDKGKETNKDSAAVLDSGTEALIKERVAAEVKAILGVTDTPKNAASGSALDSAMAGNEDVIGRDYASFLDR